MRQQTLQILQSTPSKGRSGSGPVSVLFFIPTVCEDAAFRIDVCFVWWDISHHTS